MNIGKRIGKKTEEGILRRNAPRNLAFLEGSNEGKLDIFGDFHHKFGDIERQQNGRQGSCCVARVPDRFPNFSSLKIVLHRRAGRPLGGAARVRQQPPSDATDFLAGSRTQFNRFAPRSLASLLNLKKSFPSSKRLEGK